MNTLWFVVFSIINLLYPVADRAWLTYWHTMIIINAVLSAPCAVWFTVGGVMDIRALFKHLETARRDEKDDGRVLVGTTNQYDPTGEIDNVQEPVP